MMEEWNTDGIVKSRHSRENGNPDTVSMKVGDQALKRLDSGSSPE